MCNGARAVNSVLRSAFVLRIFDGRRQSFPRQTLPFHGSAGESLLDPLQLGTLLVVPHITVAADPVRGVELFALVGFASLLRQGWIVLFADTADDVHLGHGPSHVR